MRLRKPLGLLILAILAMTLSLGCVSTQQAVAPSKAEAKADWKFHSIVGVDFVKPYAKLPKPENALIIDSRPTRPKYDKGHIPNAVSIPDSQFAKMTDRLPKDKNALLIFYCGGPT